MEHRHQVDSFYSQRCGAQQSSSLDFIPSSEPSDSHDYIVPGFNDYIKDLHTCSVSRSDYVTWRDAGKPRYSCRNIRRSRLTVKYALRQCKKD